MICANYNKFFLSTSVFEIDSSVEAIKLLPRRVKIPESGFKKELKKVFGPADLWKVHRKRRNVFVRRYL